MTTIIKIRRDTAANWTSINPILALGEPGLETDTLKVKYGDGVTQWTGLNYAGSELGDWSFIGNTMQIGQDGTIKTHVSAGYAPNITIELDSDETAPVLYQFRSDGQFVIPTTGGIQYANGQSYGGGGSGSSLVNGDAELTLNSDGTVTLPNNALDAGLQSLDVNSKEYVAMTWNTINESPEPGEPYQTSIQVNQQGTFVRSYSASTPTKEWLFTNGGDLNLPTDGGIRFNYGYIDQDAPNNLMRISAGENLGIFTNEDGTQWTFDSYGNLTLPTGGAITSVTPTTPEADGNYVAVVAGDGATDGGEGTYAGDGGQARLYGGWAGDIGNGGEAGDGGFVDIRAGGGSGADDGRGLAAGTGGKVIIVGGDAGQLNGTNSSLAANGGNVEIYGGMSSVDSDQSLPQGVGGDVKLFGGNWGSVTKSSGNVSINTYDGSNFKTWTFDNTGSMTAPGVILGSDMSGYELRLGANFNEYDEGRWMRLRSGDVTSHIHLDTSDNYTYDFIIGDDNKHVQISNAGNILISSYQPGLGNSNKWDFDPTGTVTVPGSVKAKQGTAWGTFSVLGVTQSSPAVVTADDMVGASDGSRVQIFGVNTMTGINGSWFIKHVNESECEMYVDQACTQPVDATGWPPYIATETVLNTNDLSNSTLSVYTNDYPGVLNIQVGWTANDGSATYSVTDVFDNGAGQILLTMDGGAFADNQTFTFTSNDISGSMLTGVDGNDLSLNSGDAPDSNYGLAGNVVIGVDGVSGSHRWTFNNQGALELANYGVLKGSGGEVNIVSTSFSQLQWVADHYDSDNPNDDARVFNWMYVDSDGTWIESKNRDIGVEYSWLFDNYGSFNLSSAMDPNGSRTQKSIRGAVETIKGDPYANDIGPSDATVWTASAADIIGAKMTVRVQAWDGTNVEMFDVMLAKQLDNSNVSYTVSNRLKTNDSAGDTIVNVDLNVDNYLVLTLRTASGSAAITYSVTEFGNTYD